MRIQNEKLRQVERGMSVLLCCVVDLLIVHLLAISIGFTYVMQTAHQVLQSKNLIITRKLSSKNSA